jgi:M6 family metalloprotease-like protein
MGFVLRLAAAAACFAMLAGSAIAQTVSSFDGILTVTWGDPRPGASGGTTRFELTTTNNTVYSLQIAPDQQASAVTFFGKRVRVHGNLNAAADTVSGGPVISVDSIESTEPARDHQPATKAKTTRKVLFLLLQFKGDTQKTHSVSFYTDELTNPTKPPAGSKNPATINGFFNKVSYGNLKWKGDVGGKGGLNPTKWLVLPKTKQQYANCGWNGSCANLTQLRTDALALADAQGINWKAYDNINFVVNNDLDCCAWGGSFVSNMKTYGATYEPPWSQQASTYVHEMGHSLGLPHSGYVYYAYDSHHDEMSRGNNASSKVCSTYKSVNDGNKVDNILCTEPGAGYIMAHQDYLGWIPTANKALVDKKGTKTFTIEANSAPMGSALKMVKVCISGFACSGAEGSTARFLTLEVKKKAGGQFDKGLPSEGLVIHDVKMNARNTASGSCFFNNQSGWAYPVDATPGDFNKTTCQPQDVANTGLLNMPFTSASGKNLYNDTKLKIKVEVLSETSKTMTVKVTKSK